jgi:hypothetical protein
MLAGLVVLSSLNFVVVISYAASSVLGTVTIRSVADANKLTKQILRWVRADDSNARKFLTKRDITLIQKVPASERGGFPCRRNAVETIQYWCSVGFVTNEPIIIEMVFEQTATKLQFRVRMSEDSTH